MGDDVRELEISSLNLNLIKAGNIEIFSALINEHISVCWKSMLGDEKNQGKLIQDQCFLLKLV